MSSISNNRDEKIYYYTSNEVLCSWLTNEQLWATRSITSNDNEDTTYALKHFDKINTKTNKRFEKKLQKVDLILSLSQKISLKFYKDLLHYCMKYHFNDFSKIINTVEKRKEYFYYGDNYDLFTIDKFHEHCGTFHIPHLQNPNRDQWIYNQLLSILTPDEYKYFFNINTNTIDDYKKIIPKLPFMRHPFVICFTSEKDNRFFWDSYTNNKGVALEFSRNELSEYFQVPKTHSNYSANLVNIIYNKDKQLSEITNFLNSNIGELLMVGVENLYIDMAKYKHPYWKDEKEIRAVIEAKYYDEKSNLIKENYNLKYKTKYDTQDYIEVVIPKNLLKKIIIGPQNSVENIKQILDIGNFNYIKDKFEESSGTGVINLK